MLTDPREALAEESNFIGYLVGLAGLARAVHALAADGHPRANAPREADESVYLLLGFASVGEAINRLAESPPALSSATAGASPPPSTNTRWLR